MKKKNPLNNVTNVNLTEWADIRLPIPPLGTAICRQVAEICCYCEKGWVSIESEASTGVVGD